MENNRNNLSQGRESVRGALLNLPKAACPAGFETRLTRRLADNGSGRTESKWYLSWAGAGLGFAAVVLFSVVAMKPSQTSITSPMQANVASPTPNTETIVEPQSNVAMDPSAVDPITTQTEADTQLAAAKDSATHNRGKLPEGRYEVTNGTAIQTGH